MTGQKLSIGRVVHYVEPTANHSPAIVTKVWGDDVANVTIFEDQRLPKFMSSLKLDEVNMLPGTIHWPEREED